MSQTLDTNVLVYATHTASPFHPRARSLVEHLVAALRSPIFSGPRSPDTCEL